MAQESSGALPALPRPETSAGPVPSPQGRAGPHGGRGRHCVAELRGKRILRAQLGLWGKCTHTDTRQGRAWDRNRTGSATSDPQDGSVRSGSAPLAPEPLRCGFAESPTTGQQGQGREGLGLAHLHCSLGPGPPASLTLRAAGWPPFPLELPSSLRDPHHLPPGPQAPGLIQPFPTAASRQTGTKAQAGRALIREGSRAEIPPPPALSPWGHPHPVPQSSCPQELRKAGSAVPSPLTTPCPNTLPLHCASKWKLLPPRKHCGSTPHQAGPPRAPRLPAQRGVTSASPGGAIPPLPPLPPPVQGP